MAFTTADKDDTPLLTEFRDEQERLPIKRVDLLSPPSSSQDALGRSDLSSPSDNAVLIKVIDFDSSSRLSSPVEDVRSSDVSPADDRTSNVSRNRKKGLHRRSYTVDYETVEDKKYASGSIITGFLWVALSACIFSVNTFLSKLASEAGIPLFQLLSARGMFQLILIACNLGVQGVNPFATKALESSFLLLLHGFSALLAIGGLFFGLKFLDISDATVFFFTAPIYTAVLGRFILREKLGRTSVLAFVFCFVGIVFTARPPFIFGQPMPMTDKMNEYPLLPVIITNAAAIFQAIGYISVRKVQSKFFIDPQVVVFYNALICALVPPHLALFLENIHQNLPRMTYLYLFGMGFCTFLGQIALNKGFKLAPAAPASLIRNVDVVLVFFIDIIYHNWKLPPYYSVIGALLVVCSSVLIFLDKRNHQVSRLSSASIAE